MLVSTKILMNHFWRNEIRKHFTVARMTQSYSNVGGNLRCPKAIPFFLRFMQSRKKQTLVRRLRDISMVRTTKKEVWPRMRGRFRKVFP